MNPFFSPDAATLVAVATAEAAPPLLVSSHAAPKACLNCATPLTDKFCGHCGQPAPTA